MNLRQNQKGFTIVELLIVVVVIAILAAISVVAFTGITNRANRSAAMETANSVRSVATAYQGANSTYPVLKSDFVSGGTDAIAKLPNDITFLAAPLTTTAPSSPKSVYVQKRGSTTAPTGFIIQYWDYAPASGSPAPATIEVGEGTALTGTGSYVAN